MINNHGYYFNIKHSLLFATRSTHFWNDDTFLNKIVCPIVQFIQCRAGMNRIGNILIVFISIWIRVKRIQRVYL